jgi:deuterolysin
MLRSVLFLSLGALALATSADDLKVTVKAVSSSVDSIEDIILSAIITNPTSEDIRVLAKNNVLDGGSTSSFAVSKDDKDLLFTGVRVGFSFVIYFSALIVSRLGDD